jgi:predicted nucleotidyltransferase
MTRNQILSTLRNHKNYIEEHFKVQKIGLFGSYAHDLHSSKSDIDFYVEFKEKTYDNLAGLWVYLEELYHKNIDIVYKHKNNNKIILSNIQRDVIYG